MRRFTIVAAASFLLLLCTASAKVHKVLILGAGSAGVAAGKQLTDSGITDFVILEASDRIGGRLRSAQFGGRTVELGATWIQGLGNNPIYLLAQKYGLQTEPYDFDDWIIRNWKGQDVTAAADALSEKFEAAMKNIKTQYNKKLAEHEPDMSLRAALRYGGWDPKLDPVADVVEYYDIDFEYAIPAEEVPLKYRALPLATDKYPGGERLVTDQRGYVYILERLAAEYLQQNDSRLKLNHVVTKVEYQHHPRRQYVKVTTRNGAVFEAEYALITFSLGVMQSQEVQYAPPLPAWKMDALHNMRMGYYLIIFVKFPQGTTRFWDNNRNILFAHPHRGYYTYWMNIGKDSNMLAVTVVDQEARAAARLDKQELKAELDGVLSKMYGNRARKIEDIFLHNFIDDPLFHGMYSSTTFGMTNKTFHGVSAPAGPLFFAGEHTTIELFGYLQGAHLSGIKAAKDIHECQLNRYCPTTFFVPGRRPGFFYQWKK